MATTPDELKQRVAEAATLWTATYVLMGLRYEEHFTAQLLRGVREMKESVTYQAIIREGLAEGRSQGLAEGRSQGLAEGAAAGRIEEARKLLLRIGSKRFGPPDAEITTAVEAITNLKQLEALSDRLLDVASWEELLGQRPRRGNGKRRKRS